MMEPCAYRFDGTWEGLLTAVFIAVRDRTSPAALWRAEDAPVDLFTPLITVPTDAASAARVEKGLLARMDRSKVRDLMTILLAERQEADSALLHFIIRAFQVKPAFIHDPREPLVLELRTWRKKLRHEAHHMEAFVRFREHADGTWRAVVAPAYDVLPLIARHFRRRYADMHWRITDERRGYAIAFDGYAVHFVTDQVVPQEVVEKEAAFNVLWRTYFKHVDIPERRNLGLQMQRMPKRFWRYMLEMNS